MLTYNVNQVLNIQQVDKNIRMVKNRDEFN